MNKAYLVVNGIKMSLTEEQKKYLGLTLENSFAEPAMREKYYYITSEGNVDTSINTWDDLDNRRLDEANCFKCLAFAKFVAKRQLLYRLLLKFAYVNDAVDKPWNGCNHHFYIRYKYDGDKVDESACDVGCSITDKSINEIYFSKKSVAEEALETVVKPFLSAFPEIDDYRVCTHSKGDNENE